MPFVVIIIMAHHLNYGDEKCKAPGVSSSLSYDATAAFAILRGRSECLRMRECRSLGIVHAAI